MRILLILVLGGIAIGLPNCAKVARSQERELPVRLMESRLQVSILPSKRRYKLNEQFKMLVMLMNSGKKEIYVFGTLEWGHLASFLFHIHDASGKEIRPRAFPDDQTLVSREDRNSFVKLLPNHFLGTDFYAPVNLLGLNRPGKYSIFVEYHSPVSSADTDLRPVWSKENNSIKSNVVFFEVVR
jgi:hypothetical protein